MERTGYYGFFALRCGWTVEQVDSQPDWYIQRFPAFVAITDEIEAERAKAAAK
jgi:hypothetical protein